MHWRPFCVPGRWRTLRSGVCSSLTPLAEAGALWVKNTLGFKCSQRKFLFWLVVFRWNWWSSSGLVGCFDSLSRSLLYTSSLPQSLLSSPSCKLAYPFPVPIHFLCFTTDCWPVIGIMLPVRVIMCTPAWLSEGCFLFFFLLKLCGFVCTIVWHRVSMCVCLSFCSFAHFHCSSYTGKFNETLEPLKMKDPLIAEDPMAAECDVPTETKSLCLVLLLKTQALGMNFKSLLL